VPLREAFKRLAPNVVILDASGPQAQPHRIAKVYVLQAGQAGLAPPVAGETVSPLPPTALATAAPQAVPRPEPFKFTFDPSQPGKQSP
jgi:hypothetical protein